MDDKQLDLLLEELAEVEVIPSAKRVQEAREKARAHVIRQEKKKEWLPFVIVIFLNILLVSTEVAVMICFSTNFQQVSIFIGLGVFSTQLPVAAYLLSKIYYKEKELENR